MVKRLQEANIIQYRYYIIKIKIRYMYLNGLYALASNDIPYMVTSVGKIVNRPINYKLT
jgi:hypothetical protein